MYQLHQLILVWMLHDFLLECVAKKVEITQRHSLEAWVRRNAVIHG